MKKQKRLHFLHDSPLSISPTMQQIIFMIILSYCTHIVCTHCPATCECKWVDGKEAVLCLNQSITVVPLKLDVSTQILDLTGNNLATLHHDEFRKAGLVNLQKIYIAKCRLKTLERYAFRKLINLVELDLSYNVLSTVPSQIFDSMPQLTELKLNGNPIVKISNDQFLNTPHLERLEMNDCKLSVIEPRAFFGLEKKLAWLKLDRNKLIEVPSRAFTILRSLQGLHLSGNNWNCSCELRPLREWMLRQNVPFGIPPTCTEPNRVSGRTWDRLELDDFACAPEISAFDSKTTGVEGKNITMTCAIKGVPEPNVRWMLKNKVIANLSGSSYSSGKKLYLVHLNNNSSDLTIFSADLQDTGTYVCAAENKAGKAEASVTLAVTKKPPESTISNKVLVLCVILGVCLVIILSVLFAFICSLRKQQVLKWRSRECRREDNYEKIEMSQKVLATSNGGSGLQDNILVHNSRKNGEYCVVPCGDTDQEVEEEDISVAKSSKLKAWRSPDSAIDKTWTPTETEELSKEKRWNSPEHMLDPEDLHIPRRTIQEARDKKPATTTPGTYNQYLPSTSVTNYPPVLPRRQPPIGGSGQNIYTTTYNNELSNLPVENKTFPGRTFPDIIGNASYGKLNSNTSRRANSEGGSVTDITELFCTLPRKKALVNSSKYKSTDSQAPLLPDSRYNSSGGESSYGSQENNSHRKLPDNPKLSNLNKNRVNKISNSYLNLSRDDQNSTPLLDVAGLEKRVNNKRENYSGTYSQNSNTYDHHAAQLEKFLEEYRTLQKELTKMKETCDNLKTAKTPNTYSYSPVTPSSSGSSGNKNNPLTPNSNKSLEDSVEFKNFESEFSKYLMSKSTSPSGFSPKSAMNNI